MRFHEERYNSARTHSPHAERKAHRRKIHRMRVRDVLVRMRDADAACGEAVHNHRKNEYDDKNLGRE